MLLHFYFFNKIKSLILSFNSKYTFCLITSINSSFSSCVKNFSLSSYQSKSQLIEFIIILLASHIIQSQMSQCKSSKSSKNCSCKLFILLSYKYKAIANAMYSLSLVIGSPTNSCQSLINFLPSSVLKNSSTFSIIL